MTGGRGNAKRGRSSAEGQVVPVLVVPVPPVKPVAKNKRQKSAVEAVEADSALTRKDVQDVDLTKTMRDGDLLRAKAACSETNTGESECGEVKKMKVEMEEMRSALASVNAQLDEFLEGVKVWQEIVESLTYRVVKLEGTAPAETDWSLDHLVRIDLLKRVFYMNNGHCTQATNVPFTYQLDEDEEYGLCLHCFDEGRGPECCVFKGGRKGVKMHRKPKAKDAPQAKCCKPGVADPNDAKSIRFRMLYAKDFLVFK